VTALSVIASRTAFLFTADLIVHSCLVVSQSCRAGSPARVQHQLIPLSTPAGVDKRFPKGTIYPGVIALYRALTEARHYRRMHRIQSQRMFGNLAANGSPAPADSASVVSAQDSVQVDQVCILPGEDV
jgi:hypothetical protein